MLIKGLSSILLVLMLSAPVSAQESATAQNTEAAPHSKQAIEELLAAPKYRFCNDAEYQLSEDEKANFCETAQESAGICPGLVAACARPAWDERQKKKSGAWNFGNVSWLGFLVQILFWGALAVGLIILLWNALKVAKSQTFDFEKQKGAPMPQPIEVSSDAAALGETQEELLRTARKAASEERFKESLLLLYQATLQGLGDLGWIRLRKSKTSGDYARLMRRRLQKPQAETIGSSEHVEEAITHLRDLERERFAPLDKPTETLQLLERTSSLLGRWKMLMIGLLSLMSQGCDPQAGIELPDSPTAPGGTLLFEELVAKHAAKSQRRFRRLESVDEETTAVVSIGAKLGEDEWSVLSSWVQTGGALVVIEPSEEFSKVFEQQVSTAICSGELLTGGYHVASRGQWLAFDKLEAHESYFVCGERMIIAGIEWGEGWVTVIASHDLIRNAHLVEADHAALVMESIMVDGAEVELVGTWTGTGATSPIQSMIQGDFGIWVAHVLVFFAVAAWGLGRRFGKPVDPPRLRRRAFSEHAVALAVQYQRAGAHRFVLRRFAEWSSEQLRRSGSSGAKLRQNLSSEFMAALDSSDSSARGVAPSNEPALLSINIFRKLRDVSHRRPNFSPSGPRFPTSKG